MKKEHKFDTDREDLYQFKREAIRQRTKKRLIQIADMGLEEVGLATFGIPGVLSGLYIEKVWHYLDKDWDEYVEWIAGKIVEADEKVKMQNRMATDQAKSQSEIEAVKQLGEQIGYGHLMGIASALWRESLKEKNYPESGAFVPTIRQWIKTEGYLITKESCDMYDKLACRKA